MIRIAAPAPACVAAPAGAIGRAAEAAEAQRKARASGNDAPTERAFSRTKTASAAKRPGDRDQEPGLRGGAPASRVLLHPAAHLPATDERQARDAREEEDEERSCDTRGRDQSEADLDAARARPGCSDRRHRRQRGTVEQADDDQGEADRAETGGLLPGPAAHDGDSDRLVEASRQRHAPDRGGTACGGERQRFGAFILGEEPLPAPGLEGVGEQEEDPGGAHQDRIRIREWPAGMDEMHDRESSRGKSAGHEDGVHTNADSARACESSSSPHAGRYRELG